MKDGRIDGLLSEHSEHLSRINGSVERAALAGEALTRAIHELETTTRDSLATLEARLLIALADVASDVRTLNEDARLRDERVEVARKTLATETERRRTDLADTATAGSSRFTKRQQLATLAVAIIGLVLSGLVVYLSTR